MAQPISQMEDTGLLRRTMAPRNEEGTKVVGEGTVAIRALRTHRNIIEVLM